MEADIKLTLREKKSSSFEGSQSSKAKDELEQTYKITEEMNRDLKDRKNKIIETED